MGAIDVQILEQHDLSANLATATHAGQRMGTGPL
jgi:hypothetical protein